MAKEYCGREWWPKWFRRAISNRFNESCRIHDSDYTQGKGTRKQADERFYRNMKAQSKSRWDRFLAAVFYASVRAGGWASWENKP